MFLLTTGDVDMDFKKEGIVIPDNNPEYNFKRCQSYCNGEG